MSLLSWNAGSFHNVTPALNRFGALCSTRPRDRSIAAAAPAPGGSGRPLILVSVADEQEAALALAAGADVLDLKDPRLGPLGACAPATLRAVAALRDRRAPGLPLSAALGPARDLAARRLAGVAAECGYDVVKAGCEGIAAPEAATAALVGIAREARRGRPGLLVVAATYADAARVGAIPLDLLPDAAAHAGLDGCLLDTAVKDGRALGEHLPVADLAAFAAECHRRGLLCALAGSIGPQHLPAIAAARPDLIGARGALCEGGRAGRFDPVRLAAFRRILERACPPAGRPPAPLRN
jgi:uncharacterized protein (UPF0264 family)